MRSAGALALRVGVWLALLAGLYVAQLHSYLLFHSLVEIFSVAVAAALFMLAWNSRHFVERHFLLWIGIGYAFVGMVDLVHTLAYNGMGVFGDIGVDVPTQLWVAARFMQAATLLVAPLFFERRLNARAALAGFGAVTTLVFLSIFTWDVFPSAWSDAAGALTPFKIISEYVVCGLLFGAAVWMLFWRDRLDPEVLGLLIGSIAATLVAELSFTLYSDPYGLPNLVGHYLKLIAFYLIYKAVVEAGLRRPYDVLFRDLKQHQEQLERSQHELKALNETLEQRVEERTRQTQMLARQLAQAEDRERERLASILHDDLQQILAAARMRVQMGAKARQSAERMLEEADEQLSEAIHVSRCLAVEVSPAIVRERGLGAALEWLGEHMRERHGLTVDVTIVGTIDLGDSDLEAVVFRIVRELLFNVVKHAGVNSATVRASSNDDGGLCVTVRDEGCGFDIEDLASTGSQGFGLSSVRYRLEMIGGSCLVNSSPGQGTEVTMTVPFSQD